MMASPLAAASSRASTPESPLAQADTTIDDLTSALSNFSSAPTPDPPITCCCRREDCEAFSSWASFRAKLEARLVLSAEVGQALLQRHEMYVRRQDATLSSQVSATTEDVEDVLSLRQRAEYLTKKVDTVTEENALMESRLNELFIKHEMTDVANRTVLRELQEARATVSRLSAHNARSVGWEMRLAQQIQEKEDMRQERDSECHRAKLAESKAAAFVDKCSKLQNEVHALRQEVHNFRVSRADFSKNVLQEARARLESLQHSLGRDQTREDPETTRVLESLVADNETLKRDIAELQNLLVEAREDVRTLREELEEHRASAPSLIDDITKVEAPSPTALYLPRTPVFGRRGHHRTISTASASSMLHGLPNASTPYASSPGTPVNARHHRRSPSGNTRLVGDDAIVEWDDGQHDSLLSPHIPRSPTDALLPPDVKHMSMAHSTRHSPSHHSRELDRESQHDVSPATPEKHRGSVKSLLLLSRSRGVQTDPQVAYTMPSPRPFTLGMDRDSAPSTPAPEGRSDTSSISQQDGRAPGAVAALIERVGGLLVRMIQADVRTLTNRLKRQHLLPSGGDARHLSHSTVSGIQSEVANLRAPVGTGRDDPASPSLTVTRSDIKALLKLFKDMFMELGTLREQVNDVVFDPSVAHKLRKEATEPERAKGEPRPASAMGGWIAPIQKLFTNPPPIGFDFSNTSGGANKPATEVGRGRAPARVVPKLAPAIAASSTTVNVEFASTGVRKTDASDQSMRVSSSSAGVPAGPSQHITGPSTLRRPVAVPHSASRNLMGIFAGAPQTFHNPPASGEGWVVLPKMEKDRARQLKDATSNAALGASSARNAGTIRRSSTRNPKRLSRNVDAIIDQEEEVPDFHVTLLERTLRPRGLSDSSIHATFMKGEVSDSHPEKLMGNTPWSTLPEQVRLTGASSPLQLLPASPPKGRERTRSPAARLGSQLASWATVATGGHFGTDGVDLADGDILVGSPREEGPMHHVVWARRGLQGRDF